MIVWSLFIIDDMGLFFYNKIGSIISIGDLPTTNIIEPILLKIRIFFYILLCNQGFQTNLHHICEGILAFFCSCVLIWID
ncbi:hypothetical protein GEZ85_07265 [Streptococcus mitis]|uniref:Uncharacterized protein n=1 Tax=Streptococcus mitis TaxID=28037 RepID=A0A6I1UJU2_STRMT|nr:hypothetical protein [Streptococcus mitis]MQQ41241.1 hypothetical protein [Streptococcus mitis]MQQ62300.1 hypothetical protein [Streptococcus mitis]